MFGEQALTGVAVISMHEVLQRNCEIDPALQCLCAIRRGEVKYFKKMFCEKCPFERENIFWIKEGSCGGSKSFSVFCGCCATSCNSFQR